jgi:hypothetical protein
MKQRVQRDLPHVMHENIDNEVVVVNLTTGIYYSFDGSAVDIWDWIDGQRTKDDVVRIATQVFQGEEEPIAKEVLGFLEQLQQENLVAFQPAEGAEGGSDPQTPRKSVPFIAPKLQKYTDMEALLLADPIHEVDETTGWPHKK